MLESVYARYFRTYLFIAILTWGGIAIIVNQHSWDAVHGAVIVIDNSPNVE